MYLLVLKFENGHFQFLFDSLHYSLGSVSRERPLVLWKFTLFRHSPHVCPVSPVAVWNQEENPVRFHSQLVNMPFVLLWCVCTHARVYVGLTASGCARGWVGVVRGFQHFSWYTVLYSLKVFSLYIMKQIAVMTARWQSGTSGLPVQLPCCPCH